MRHSKEQLQDMLTVKEMDSSTLEILIKAKSNGEINFHLIDIREVFEFNMNSIDKTDLLLPTSMIQKHLNKLEAIKDEPIILYCRTGNRTSQMMNALENMGFTKVVHLSRGIISFDGEKSNGAKIPNEL